MAIITKPFGHPKARKFLKGTHIPIQAVKLQGDTLLESAMVVLIAQAWEGKGPLAKTLKTEASDLVDKFNKSNPDYKFSKFGRDRTKNVEVEAKSSKQPKSDKENKPSKKPAKTTKKADKPAKKKAQKSQDLEPALV